MSQRMTMVLAALAIAGLATGCSSGVVGTDTGVNPTPEPPSSSTASDGGGGDDLPRDGAPKVPHPVDVNNFKQSPCSVLTAEQRHKAGITVEGDDQGDIGSGYQCIWEMGPDGLGISVTFLKNSGGLSDLYAENKTGRFEVFKPVPDINGFPAVLAMAADQRSGGNCVYDVGVNDHDVVDVAVSNETRGDPCADVRSVANGVTKTILTSSGGE